MQSKKAVELALNTAIIAVILLFLLAVMFVMVSKSFGATRQGLYNCENKGATCMNTKDCQPEKGFYSLYIPCTPKSQDAKATYTCCKKDTAPFDTTAPTTSSNQAKS